jgi:hypothetical protein
MSSIDKLAERVAAEMVQFDRRTWTRDRARRYVGGSEDTFKRFCRRHKIKAISRNRWRAQDFRNADLRESK